jgi:hypothetical protein
LLRNSALLVTVYPQIESEPLLEEDSSRDGNLRNFFKKEEDQKDKSYRKRECPVPFLEAIKSHQHKQTQYAHGYHPDYSYPVVESEQDGYAGNGNHGHTFVIGPCGMAACLGAVIEQQNAQESK